MATPAGQEITFVNVTPESIETEQRWVPLAERPAQRAPQIIGSTQHFERPTGLLHERVTDTLKRLNYRMEWYSKNRIDFPLGYQCTLPPWSAKLFEQVNKDLAAVIEREKPDSKGWLAYCASIVFNQHLLLDTTTNKVGYRNRVERRGHWYTQLIWQKKNDFIETFSDFFAFSFKFPGDKNERRYSLLEMYCKSPYVQAVNSMMFVPYHRYDTDLPRYLPSDTLNLFHGLRYDNDEALACWRTNELARRQVATFLLHHCYVICNAWRDRTNYSLLWMAKKVRHPHWKPNTAIVIHGREGAGKTR